MLYFCANYIEILYFVQYIHIPFIFLYRIKNSIVLDKIYKNSVFFSKYIKILYFCTYFIEFLYLCTKCLKNQYGCIGLPDGQS